MTTSSYDILFEPVRIGPKTTRNRFYQVPHCTGMGWMRPRMLADMRAVKAEGGWAVVCTEYNSIHPTSDDLPTPSASLWNDSDIRAHRLMTDMVHEYGALAGAELWYGGHRSANLMTRQVAMDIQSVPNAVGHPLQTRAMDKTDIRNLRRWHRKAALRARDAGFDIVYVYATHTYLLANFLNPRVNTRSDEYGGSLENRTRLIRELIEETKEAVGDRCAVAVRFSADEQVGEDGVPIHGERRDMFEMMADLPDIWDVNIADYSLEMGVSRFIKEGSLEPYMDFVKSVTSKPVVTVGRFTSPDTMVSQIKRGIVDFIGAARPSIADPYLPSKIERGALSEIRECIGCNICYASDARGAPLRCTQNPTMGEEWRAGWHPETVTRDGSGSVLIVGGGPAGLEAAHILGKRGFDVSLSDARREPGGRVTLESRLPSLGTWARVRDYRLGQIDKLSNVALYLESRMAAEDVAEFGADHVVLATGARWRDDGIGRSRATPVACTSGAKLTTPDDVMAGAALSGAIVVFDDDVYYMGAVIAEKLACEGCAVTYVTTNGIVAWWSSFTAEQGATQARLIELGVDIVVSHVLDGFDGARARLSCVYSGKTSDRAADHVVSVTARLPELGLHHALMAAGRPATIIGDCHQPSIIAAAVHSGHGAALALGREAASAVKRDRVVIGA